MTTIVSRNISSSPTETDYNQLRADVVSNHLHDGSGGAKIQHKNLLFGSGYTIVNDHEDIDSHIAGASGVHGKLSGVYAAGVLGGNFTIVTGKWKNNEDNTCGAGLSPIPANGGFNKKWYVSLSGEGNFTCTDPITSNGHTKFANTNYFVFIQITADTSSELWHDVAIVVSAKYQTYFEISIYNSSSDEIPVGKLKFEWMAIGQLETV